MSRHAQALVQVRLEVVDHVDTTELGEDLHEHGEEESLPVAWCPEDLTPADIGDGLLEADLIAHLAELGAEETVILSNVAVKALDDSYSLVIALLLKQPSGGVREEVDTDEHDDGRENLEGEGEAPLERAVGVGTSETNPLCLRVSLWDEGKANRRAEASESFTYVSGSETKPNELSVQPSNHTTLCGWCDFRVVDGNGYVHHTNGETSDDSSGDEHANVNRGGLDDACDHGDSGRDSNGLFPADGICGPCCKEYAENGTGVESTDNSSLDASSEWVKVGPEVLLCDDCRNNTGVDTVTTHKSKLDTGIRE